jgi:hypothetical protein
MITKQLNKPLFSKFLLLSNYKIEKSVVNVHNIAILL